MIQWKIGVDPVFILSLFALPHLLMKYVKNLTLATHCEMAVSHSQESDCHFEQVQVASKDRSVDTER